MNSPAMPEPKQVTHRCAGCGREFPHGFTPLCECGSMVETWTDLSKARLYDSSSPYVRYFDLLPIENPEHIIDVDHTATPCRHAEALGEELGLERLYLKNETVFPTHTTKDRMATAVLSLFQELGITEFAASSTGNSSTSFAHYVPLYPACRPYLFSGEDFLDRLNFEDNGQTIVFALRGATFVEAFEEAKVWAGRRGVLSERGFFNPARRAGLKTAFLEATEQVPTTIDWYVQAVSSAMGVHGTWQGANEFCEMGVIERPPRLLCVQQDTCCPMVKAFEAGSPVIRPEDVFAHPTGLASAILRGDPTRVYPTMRKLVMASGGTFRAVSAEQLEEARSMVRELEGIDPCYAASTAVAGLIDMAREGRVPPDDTVLINLTGGERPDRKPPSVVHWLVRHNDEWVPEEPGNSVTRELWEGSA